MNVSIVIPVYNKWELTRNCLKSLAKTTDPAATEVIVVDNASSDPTPRAAPFLGRQLFGDSFVFIRNEINRNFAGASNQGALQARGDWLVFLNNDTIPLSGWLRQLLDDFGNFSGIGATGPLLLYDKTFPFGHTVQHLGVDVNPIKIVEHLYRGISGKSKLATKRRFFQIITAACMCMPKRLFLETGSFDENFINGFEDVDLCARLVRADWRQTINPKARVIHLESQSAGRHAHTAGNLERYRSGTANYLKPDIRDILKADNLELEVSRWLNWQIKIPDAELTELTLQSNAIQEDGLLKILTDYPYWEAGWKKLLDFQQDTQMRLDLRKKAIQFFPSPELMLENAEDALKNGNFKVAYESLQSARPFFIKPEDYLKSACFMKKKFYEDQDFEMAKRFSDWEKTYDNFAQNIYLPLQDRMKRLEAVIGKSK